MHQSRSAHSESERVHWAGLHPPGCPLAGRRPPIPAQSITTVAIELDTTLRTPRRVRQARPKRTVRYHIVESSQPTKALKCSRHEKLNSKSRAPPRRRSGRNALPQQDSTSVTTRSSAAGTQRTPVVGSVGVSRPTVARPRPGRGHRRKCAPSGAPG